MKKKLDCCMVCVSKNEMFRTGCLNFSLCDVIVVGVSRGYTDHHQGRGHSIRPTAALINIHEHLI